MLESDVILHGNARNYEWEWQKDLDMLEILNLQNMNLSVKVGW